MMLPDPPSGLRPGAVALLVLLAAGCSPRDPATTMTITRVSLDTLPAATARYDPVAGELTLEMPAIDIPGATGMHQGMIVTPATRVEIPVSGYVHSFRVEVVDPQGNLLPAHTLHHFNVMDPGRRELFAPIMLRLLAASKETGSPEVPARLIGMPLVAGQQLLLKGMLHNEDSTPLPGARIRSCRTQVSHLPGLPLAAGHQISGRGSRRHQVVRPARGAFGGHLHRQPGGPRHPGRHRRSRPRPGTTPGLP
jgi:hypothetical protein